MALLSITHYIGFISPTMAQDSMGTMDTASCNRPDFDRTQDTGIYIWQLCASKQWFLRVSAGGLPTGVELRVIGNLKLDKPIVSITPFSIASNDLLDSSDPENIKMNLRVFIAAQDGFDFELEDGTTACLNITTSIDAPIVIGSQNIVVSSPANIEAADNSFCITPLLIPSMSLILEDQLL